MKKYFATLILSSFVALGSLAGCGGESEQTETTKTPVTDTQTNHDPDDVALTPEQIKALEDGIADYSDALTKIKSFRDTIRDSVAAGKPSKAHRPLDELDVILNHLPQVARDSNIPKSDWEAVNTTAQQVRDLFNKVHADIDSGNEPDYTSVSDGIDKAIETLDGIQPAE
jgi:hypothetical protein